MMNTFLYHPGQTNKETARQFTPANIMANWAFSHFGFMARLVNSGNQLMNPAMTVRTASIDRT